MDENVEKKKLFNETWDLLDKENRSDEDNIMMLHKAHTSCYLWKSSVDNPINNARGEWQVSRVYSVLGYGEPALLHAKQTLKICLENGIKDFDLAFAYEACARAYAVLKNEKLMLENKEKGIEACQDIKNEKEKTYTLKELNNINI